MATSEPTRGKVKLPCPNCAGELRRWHGSPVLSAQVDTLRCEACGWSKLECPACGQPLEFHAGRYRCAHCQWMGYGDSYRDDSDGTPQPGAPRAERQPPATKCSRCGAPIQPGDLVIRHETNRSLMACEKCAIAGGFAHMLQRYR